MKRKKKPRSLRFYLCLLGSLAGIYLVLVAVLAIRNPVNKDGADTSTVVETDQSSGTDDTADTDDGLAADRDKVTDTKADTKTDGTSDADEPAVKTEPASVWSGTDTEEDPLSRYGRDGEQYTQMQASDTVLPVSVSVSNKEKLENVVGVACDSVRSYLNIYAAHENLEATEAEMLDYILVGELGERYEIFMQYNDEEQTLVTVIFEPADSNHSSHVDVVPCQYTAKEIKKQVWKN